MVRSILSRARGQSGGKGLRSSLKGLVHRVVKSDAPSGSAGREERRQPAAARPEPAPEPVPAPAASAEATTAPPKAAAPAPSPAPAPEAPAEARDAGSPAAGGFSFSNIASLAAQGSLGKAAHADMSSTDLDSYRARAIANGRSLEFAGVGMNVSDDGIQFWGPVNNESARAKADGLELIINQPDCISCGTCEETTNAVFELPEGDKSGEELKAIVLEQDGPMDLIQDAIEACPVTCISWESSTEGQHPSVNGMQLEDAEASDYYMERGWDGT